MKPTLFFLSVLFIASIAQGQDLSIRQVFDFDIGDEFHFNMGNRPPNAYRFTVVDRYYSVNLDTIFYVRKHDNYASNVVYTTPPHLEYDLGNYTDTTFYTYLDSSVATFNNLEINDTCDQIEDSLFISSEYCNRTVYQRKACIDCCFEGQEYEVIFGQGLGLIYNYYGFAAENHFENKKMFYYKKGSFTCGTPDKSYYMGIDQLDVTKISIFPNPAHDKLTLSGFNGPLEITLRSLNGKVIQLTSLLSETELSLQPVSPGLYLLELKMADQVKVMRVAIN